MGSKELKGKDDKLNELKKRMNIAETGEYSDEILRKFLSASKSDVTKTVENLEMKKRFIQLLGLDSDQVLSYERLEVLEKYDSWKCVGSDRDGELVIFNEMGKTDLIGFHRSFTFHDICLGRFQMIKNLLKQHSKDMTKVGDPFSVRVTTISDLKGVNSTSLAMKHKYVIDIMLEATRVFEQINPGFLKRMFIINAPAIFAKTFSLCKSILGAEVFGDTIVCSASNTTSELKKYIDLEQLPSYLGGSKIDDDLSYFGNSSTEKIPTDMYLENKMREIFSGPDVCKISVPARDVKDIELHVTAAPSKLHIQFKSNSEIKIQLFYSPNDQHAPRNTANSNNECSTKEILSPLITIWGHIIPLDNSFYCKRPGIYTIRLDNSSSWLTTIDVTYRIKILYPSNSGNILK